MTQQAAPLAASWWGLTAPAAAERSAWPGFCCLPCNLWDLTLPTVGTGAAGTGVSHGTAQQHVLAAAAPATGCQGADMLRPALMIQWDRQGVMIRFGSQPLTMWQA